MVCKIFFSSNLVGRIFFTAVQEFFSITFVLHAIFFFRQALAGNFFSKSPTPPPPQELNGRPLRCKMYGMKSGYNDKTGNTKLLCFYLGNGRNDKIRVVREPRLRCTIFSWESVIFLDKGNLHP